MPDDWKEKLQKFQGEMDKKRIKALFEEGKFREVLDNLPQPKTDEEKKLVDQCYYNLMKESCAERKTEEACDYAKKIVQSSHTSRTMRSLAQERLKLLHSKLPTYDNAPLERFDPGLMNVDNILQIPVLGMFGTRGHKGTLNNLIHLLKKAPQELDSREERTRPLTINMIGHELFDLLHYCKFLYQVDLILPIPADAERYSIRSYNQQGEIARALSAYSSIPMYSNVLQKIRTTRSIHTLSSAKERKLELAGSMNVPQDKFYLVETKVVLLIDDVVTYGTHFEEARKVLLEAGAQRVLASAVAAARKYTPFDR
jgi:hypothetical protein